MTLPAEVIRMREEQHRRRDLRNANGRGELFSEEVDQVTDLPYMNDGDARHTLDVFSPKGSGKLPVIIEIHGGGFIMCEKDINRLHARWFAKQGFKTVNADYTLFPEGSFETILQEMANVVRWVEQNAAARGFDLEHVYMTGDSAGGFLVLLYAMVQGSEAIREHFGTELPKTRMRAVAPTAPAIRSPALDRGERGSLTRMMYPEGVPGDIAPWHDIPELMKMSEYPPLFISTTPSDDITYDACVELRRHLEKTGRPFVWKEYTARENRLEHVFNVLYPEYAESVQANTDLLEFFRSC